MEWTAEVRVNSRHLRIYTGADGGAWDQCDCIAWSGKELCDCIAWVAVCWDSVRAYVGACEALPGLPLVLCARMRLAAAKEMRGRLWSLIQLRAACSVRGGVHTL